MLSGVVWDDLAWGFGSMMILETFIGGSDCWSGSWMTSAWFYFLWQSLENRFKWRFTQGTFQNYRFEQKFAEAVESLPRLFRHKIYSTSNLQQFSITIFRTHWKTTFGKIIKITAVNSNVNFFKAGTVERLFSRNNSKLTESERSQNFVFAL